MTVSEFFEGRRDARSIFDSVRAAVVEFGPVTIRISKSQIGFRRRRLFAATWTPDRYLDGRQVPLVLTLFLPYRVAFPRWKEVAEPSPGRFTHHLELTTPEEVDPDVVRLLQLAWEEAA